MFRGKLRISVSCLKYCKGFSLCVVVLFFFDTSVFLSCEQMTPYDLPDSTIQQHGSASEIQNKGFIDKRVKEEATEASVLSEKKNK